MTRRFSADGSLNLGDAVLALDGLIGRPGRPVAASTTSEFTDLAANIMKGGGFPIGDARPIERLCTQTLGCSLRTSGYSDDVNALLLCNVFRLKPVAHVVSVRRRRRPLALFVPSCGVGDALSVEAPEVLAVVHALSGMSRMPRSMRTRIGRRARSLSTWVVLGGFVEASVVDHGCWRTSSTASSHPGQGLALVDMLSTRCEVAGTEAGNDSAVFRCALAAVWELSRIRRSLTLLSLARRPWIRSVSWWPTAWSAWRVRSTRLPRRCSPAQVAAFSRSGTLSLTIDGTR